MTKWVASSVGEFCPFKYGKGLPAKKREPGTVPVYGSNGQVGVHNEALVREPGVIVGRKGSVGEVHYSSQPFWPIDTTFYITGGEDRDVRFVYYLLKWLDMRHMNSDSAVPGLNRDAAHRLEFSCPPIADQQVMSQCLGAFDDRIELNARMALHAEELAHALLADSLGVGDNDWQTAWPIRPLGEALDTLETGSRPKGGVAQLKEGVPSIGAESIVRAGVFNFDKVKFVPHEFFETMKRGHLADGDVLLYKDGGRPGEFEPKVSMTGWGFPFDRAAINEHVYRMRVAEPMSQAFLYLWLRTDRVMEEMRRRGTGVAIPGLNSTNVKELPIIVPDTERLRVAQERVDPLIDVILARAHESRQLALARDALMSELFAKRFDIERVSSALVEVAV